MDTFIGLGIVIENDDNLMIEVENTLDLLNEYADNIMLTYPHDGDTNDWRTDSFEGKLNAMIEGLSYRTAYADMELIMGNEVYEARLSMANEGTVTVLKFEINDRDVFRDRTFEDLERVTKIFTEFIRTIDRNVHHSYIFCDNEADFLYKKERLIEVGYNPYAIIKMGDRDVAYAAWYLDGFTERNQSIH
ncbi:Imm64 family immunity protein [Erysipelothrix aquatica]|uniref:Imm64 family immunity protein n=1 Tax=Erysipelothrix aquatica TaxID=2683714 RepID=UPI0013583404|nr:Imm64 family immunity protein [Erysipelothrix aquatica]